MRGQKPKPNAVLKVTPMAERIKMNPTRRRRYTRRAVKDALRAANGMISGAAKRLGCNESTVRDYLDKFPDIEKTLWEIRESYVDLAESSLLTQISEKNTQATIFLLKCLGKKRGYVENPNVQLHAHATVGSGSWIDIMKRAMTSGDADSTVVDVTEVSSGPEALALKAGLNASDRDQEVEEAAEKS